MSLFPGTVQYFINSFIDILTLFPIISTYPLSFRLSLSCHFDQREKSKIIFQNQDSSHSLRSVRNDNGDGFLTFVRNDSVRGFSLRNDNFVCMLVRDDIMRAVRNDSVKRFSLRNDNFVCMFVWNDIV